MPEVVKSGSVRISIYPLENHGWRFGWKDAGGKWRYTSRKSLEEAKREARAKAFEISAGATPLHLLDPERTAILRQILARLPDISDLRAFEAWMESRARNKVTADTASREYLGTKPAGRNLDSLIYRLRQFRRVFGDRVLDGIEAAEIQGWLDGLDIAAPTKGNLRNAIVGLFRWARGRGYLPDSRTTEAEKVKPPKMWRKTPETYSPDDLRVMLSNVAPEFLPWLAVGAFCGLRTSEILRLRWEDFHWGRGVLILPVEVAQKLQERRVVPLPDAVRRWIPEPPQTGLICPHAPYKNPVAEPETVRLGSMVGGWKSNGLRKSWISYRCALVGFGQTAMEAGNSEAKIRSNYRDAKSAEEAGAWFGV